jgi:hypothetical protein
VRGTGLALALVIALVAGCGEPTEAAQPVARVGGLVLDARVVEHVAARDGLSPAQAHARAIDTLRLVAAGREQHAQGRADPGPVLAPRRAEHLRRAARARLWLTERFEPEHGPAAIPDDDPRLVRARQDPRLVHPELHVACQVVVEPPTEVTELAAKAAITSDPAWREAATRTLAPILARIDRNVPVGDAEACALMDREVQLSGESGDPRLHVSRPRVGGFDLDACGKTDDAGACVQPRFDPEWTAVVRALPAPGRSTPFFTRFGLHLVQLQERLPAQPAGDPATEAIVRAAVLDAWRSDALGRRLDELQRERTVRMVDPRTVEGVGGEP